MKKKIEIPTNHPHEKPGIMERQRPQNNTRGDIMRKTTDNFNSNNGPKQRSRKKSFL